MVEDTEHTGKCREWLVAVLFRSERIIEAASPLLRDETQLCADSKTTIGTFLMDIEQ
jgi:hypothetical protein